MRTSRAMRWHVGLMAGVALLTAMPPAKGAQTPNGDRSTWRVPRTLDGHPDLQGDWNHATLTPLQRPERFAGRAWMTPDEARAFERELLNQAEAQSARVPTSINEFWFERGRLATIDGRYPTSLIVDPPDGQIPALTPAAKARRSARSAEAARSLTSHLDFSVSERCLRSGSGPPYLAGAPDANLLRIVQSRDHVAIVQEKFHDARIVALADRPHVSRQIRSWVGDSRGHWEGDTLVIDTTNFTSKLEWANRFDANLHLIERFTRVATDRLLYEFTVDDPTYFTVPWTVRLPMIRTGETLHEFACHEGNYSLPNMLRGARAQD